MCNQEIESKTLQNTIDSQKNEIKKLKAECNSLKQSLSESRKNDATAIQYLNEIRSVCGQHLKFNELANYIRGIKSY